MQYLCCPRHPTRVLRSPQAGIAVAHQHASSGRRAARPALRERRRSPRAVPLRDRRRGPEGAQIRPTLVLTPPSGAFVDPASSRSRFVRSKIFIDYSPARRRAQFASSASVPPLPRGDGRGAGPFSFLNRTLKHPRGATVAVYGAGRREAEYHSHGPWHLRAAATAAKRQRRDESGGCSVARGRVQ